MALKALKIVHDSYPTYEGILTDFPKAGLELGEKKDLVDINNHYIFFNTQTGKWGWITPGQFIEHYAWVEPPSFTRLKEIKATDDGDWG